MMKENGERLPKEEKNNNFVNNTAMHHTAMTYSSIQKMKNREKEGKPKPKIKAITDRKLYNGKVDRVKLFQMMNSEWKKSPLLKK